MQQCTSVFAILILLILPIQAKGNFTVKWEIIRNPAVFGETVRLMCTVTGIDQCSDDYTRTWTHGKNDELIFNNGRLNQNIATKTKYVENVDIPCKSFSLIIKHFSESDAIDTFGCSFTVGTHMITDKKEISLTGIHFEYIPTSDLIETEFKRAAGKFHYNIKIKKVYPLPECSANYQNNPLELKFIHYDAGPFYDVRIIVNGSTDNSFCVCDIDIICKIGNRSVRIEDIAAGCESEKMDLWYLWISLIAYQFLQAFFSDVPTDKERSRRKSWPWFLVLMVVYTASFMPPFIALYQNKKTQKADFHFKLDDLWIQKVIVLLITVILFGWNNRKILYCNGRIIDFFIVLFAICTTGGQLWYPEEEKDEDTQVANGRNLVSFLNLRRSIFGGFQRKSDGWDIQITDSDSLSDANASENDSFRTASDGSNNASFNRVMNPAITDSNAFPVL